MSKKFRLENINKIRNYFLEEVKQNESTSRKHVKVGVTLNHIGHFLILASTVTGCMSVYYFASFHVFL